jgi:peptide/nickel transport system permease protein
VAVRGVQDTATRRAAVPGGAVAVSPSPGRSRGSSIPRVALRSRTAAFGAAILLVVTLCAVLAPVIAPYHPNEQSISERFLPPVGVEREGRGGTTAHWLGTDHLGRDILSRIVYGARISLLVGLSAVAISGTLGILLGLLAGYHGGRLDALIMRVADVQLAFPFILLAIAIVAVLGQGLRNVIIVLGLAGWVVFARVVRGDVLSIRERDFILAARTIGASDRTILLRHLLPNVVTPVIVIASFTVANVIILEAALSFLGLGVEPAIPTWGAMLADGRQYLSVVWWPATLPGLAIMLTVLSINMIGDRLRDVLDPRLKHL